MTRTPKTGAKPPPERGLRKAFEAVEALPTPEALKDHVDRLTGEPQSPPRRN